LPPRRRRETTRVRGESCQSRPRWGRRIVLELTACGPPAVQSMWRQFRGSARVSVPAPGGILVSAGIAEGVLACANGCLLACCLPGRCWSASGLRILPQPGATEATAMRPLTATATLLGSTAHIIDQDSFTARPSIVPVFGAGAAGVGAVGVTVVGGGVVGAGVGGDGRAGRRPGKRVPVLMGRGAVLARPHGTAIRVR